MIRRAEIKDIPRIDDLLYQVHRVHALIRPDIFKIGNKKYTDEELKVLIADDSKPIFVLDEDDTVKGYAFCAIQETPENNSVSYRKTLYIDDLCVDECFRGQHVGSRLYKFVVEFAKSISCHSLTLNVWESNDAARAFYDNMGLKPLKTTMEQVL